MRPNLKDVMALLESVSEGETFDIKIEQKGWSVDTNTGQYSMGRDRRKSVRKAIDDAESKYTERRQCTSTVSNGENDETE